MIRNVSAEDIAIRGNGTGLEYMCPTRHFVYIFVNPVFQVNTAKNEINLFNNHVLIVAPVTFAPAGAMTPSVEFLLLFKDCFLLQSTFSGVLRCLLTTLVMVWPNLCVLVAVAILKVAWHLQICNNCFYQVSELWPMGLLFRTTTSGIPQKDIFV